MDALQLTDYIHREIPITTKMGIEIVKVDEEGAILKAPLSENRNDKGMAFAGSLSTILTLAGWVYVTWLLHDRRLERKVVIGSGSVRYSSPVTENISVRSIAPSPEDVDIFLEQVMSEPSKKGKIEVTSEVFPNTQAHRIIEEGHPKKEFKPKPAASFTGTYFTFI